MVMHARKHQRINDGYFEKHQTHPYQNSKYGGSKGNNSSDRSYSHDRMRDSPNGNSYRSDSPDLQSPRDRYPNKFYHPKLKDKERGYNKYRDKYQDSSRSPKDKGSNIDGRDSYRNNHDRTNSEDKYYKREKIYHVGHWTQYISEKGIKYYYNKKSKVSQWEKPAEWLEKEKERERRYDRDMDKNYSGGGGSGGSRGSIHDKHSNPRNIGSTSSRDQQKPSSGRPGGPGGLRDNLNSTGSLPPAIREDELPDRRKHIDESQDMDISSGDSTPTSETSYSRTTPTGNTIITSTSRIEQHLQTTSILTPSRSLISTSQQKLLQYPPPLQSPCINKQPITSTPLTPTSQHMTVASPSSSSSASIPLTRIITHGTDTIMSPQKLLQQQNLLLDPGGSRNTSDVKNSGASEGTNLEQTTLGGEGPPTPTHSETQDIPDPRKAVSSPPSGLSSIPNLTTGSNAFTGLRPQIPQLDPSLQNFYREDLVNRIRHLPAEKHEKQAQKYNEEAFYLGDLQCTRVSAELKTERSTVRRKEIFAMLKEQRVQHLRQYIEELNKDPKDRDQEENLSKCDSSS